MKIPLLEFSIIAAAVALMLSYAFYSVFHLNAVLVFAGFGLVSYPILYVAAISLILALVAVFRVWVLIDSGIFEPKQ